ncbi:hypothetical protein ACHAXS_013886 [Conticribra weissflogii]
MRDLSRQWVGQVGGSCGVVLELLRQHGLWGMTWQDCRSMQKIELPRQSRIKVVAVMRRDWGCIGNMECEK